MHACFCGQGDTLSGMMCVKCKARKDVDTLLVHAPDCPEKLVPLGRVDKAAIHLCVMPPPPIHTHTVPRSVALPTRTDPRKAVWTRLCVQGLLGR